MKTRIGYIVMEGSDYEGLDNSKQPYKVYLRKKTAENHLYTSIKSNYREIIEIEIKYE